MLEINLKTKAATQTTQSFNSMCRFGDKFLGATDSGLFVLGGHADNGVQIPARIDSGMFDLGMDNKKKFRFFYFGISTVGALKLSIFGDGVLAGEYEVDGSAGGEQTIKVPITRAVKARYWQWRIENESGAYFALYSVKALPVLRTIN